MIWTQSSIQLFKDFKTNLLLPIFSSVTINLNQSSSKEIGILNGMGYILMQPDDYSASLATIKHLSFTDECSFVLSLEEPRLRPVLFESGSNMTYERNYLSFVSEVACGRWDIAVYRKYL